MPPTKSFLEATFGCLILVAPLRLLRRLHSRLSWSGTSFKLGRYAKSRRQESRIPLQISSSSNAMKTRDQCLREICEFPITYKTQNLSPRSIFERSGYSHHFASLSPKVIDNFLKDKPALIDAWYTYSGDQRHSPAFALGRFSPTRALVVFYASTPNRKEESSLLNERQACALFVYLQMESLRIGLSHIPEAFKHLVVPEQYFEPG